MDKIILLDSGFPDMIKVVFVSFRLLENPFSDFDTAPYRTLF